MTDVQGVKEGEVLHNQVEASLGEFSVRDIEDLEVSELGKGNHYAELVAVHERGV